MFKSIKYKFIVIYFILVLICLSIVGAFIINRLRAQQLNAIDTSMNYTLNAIVNTSDYLTEENWINNSKKIQKTLQNWKLKPNNNIYAISKDESIRIIASSNKLNDIISGKGALFYKNLNPKLIMESLEGKDVDKIVENYDINNYEKHISKPIFSSNGDIKGILYMTEDLSDVTSLINDSKIILTYSTLIALAITIILSYIMSVNITKSIRNLANIANKYAKGDFKQRVIVRGNDEIGELGDKFNYLAKELDETIKNMNTEKSKLSTIFNYMSEGVIAIDYKGNLIHMNSMAKKLFNLDSNFKKTKFDLDLINVKNINYNNIETLNGESLFEINDKFYKAKYAPYKQEGKYIFGIIIVLQDITKEYELDMVRKEFIANVSHELKTPITTIKTYTETLLNVDIDKKNEIDFLNVIDKEASRMSKLVSNILDLSKLNSKKLKLKFEDIDIELAINQVLDALSNLIKSKNHKIEINIPNDAKKIFADKDCLEQIFMNIISNAIKYTNPNGIIKINYKLINSEIKIFIEDNGIGIPERDIERIFERFYRVEKGRSREMGGTGLGLSIAREFILEMYGNIEVKSKYGEGTTIILTFQTR